MRLLPGSPLFMPIQTSCADFAGSGLLRRVKRRAWKRRKAAGMHQRRKR